MVRAGVDGGHDHTRVASVAANSLQRLHDLLMASCDAEGLPGEVADAMFESLGATPPSRDVRSPLADTDRSRAIREAEAQGDWLERDRLLREAETEALARREHADTEPPEEA
jgi:hypothetical protein